MAESRILLGVVSLAVAIQLISGGALEPATAAACDVQDKVSGFCSEGGIDGGDAVIRGDGIVDGGNGGGGGDTDGEDGGRDTDGGNGGGEDVIDTSMRCTSCVEVSDAITLSDLAAFRPLAPSLRMEPDGWMLVGLPANFIVGTRTHVVSGTLFDHAVDVRFTPSSYSWSWGDGTSTRSSVPGATWSSLGLPEFSTTPTSHVFDEKGLYRVSVTVSYTVEFRVATLAWRSIAGTLPGPATVVAAVAGTAKTVLVDRECTRNPSGPGC
ncbi:hypothetical protein [Mycetocola manganoxydans]|nr:hypothetical protein [Mycetocola manganoxydans]GHD48421.1 hypothetical protein GCM10008097_20380 [Mycetocola manganoxydans]